MSDTAAAFSRAVGFLRRHRGLILPAAAAAMVFVILVPLPTALMDVLLVANIALSAVILLTAIYVRSPLEFSVFPSVLLGATLLRLMLNVAITRLVLTAGAGGRSVEEAQLAAGRVVWGFSEFVTIGSWEVGVILFAIIVIIQFVVVTKGAARISEVAARFVLDAMPGKQMAIDADLNAKLITEAQARQRRERISREADFYGAMDGASKFLRGDAVAAIIILLVNVLGGFYVGLVEYSWTWSQTLALFTRLTVGDGLVTQVPAFIVSVAAALIVSRGAARTNLGEEVISQLTSRPVVLIITAVFLIALMLTSLPKMPLLMLGVGCAGLGIVLSRRRQAPARAAEMKEPKADSPGVQDVEGLLAVDPMRIEIGYALVRMVDPSEGGDLLERISSLRREVATEMGLVVPPIRIRDNMHLDAHAYVILIRGAKAAAGKLHPEQLLAVAGEGAAGKLVGREAVEPAFNTPAVWIAPPQKAQAEMMNYTVVEPAGVLMTHLAQVIRQRAADLLSRRQASRLLENLRPRAATLVDEVTRKMSTGKIQRVLQNLLREGVPIRDLETILEALGEADQQKDDVESLTEQVRLALGRNLCQQYCAEDGKLWCVCLEASLEDAITTHLQRTERGTAMTIPPDLTRRINHALTSALVELRRRGRRPVVLCTPQVRSPLRQLIAVTQPDAAVLGYNEIESVEVETVASVGLDK